jgi:hypothetical protein
MTNEIPAVQEQSLLEEVVRMEEYADQVVGRHGKRHHRIYRDNLSLDSNHLQGEHRAHGRGHSHCHVVHNRHQVLLCFFLYPGFYRRPREHLDHFDRHDLRHIGCCLWSLDVQSQYDPSNSHLLPAYLGGGGSLLFEAKEISITPSWRPWWRSRS